MNNNEKNDGYYASIINHGQKIEWRCKNRKTKQPITIWEKIQELKNNNWKKIFVSIYDPYTRESTEFMSLNKIENETTQIENLLKIQDLSKERIKGALIFENDEWIFYDIAINRPIKNFI